VVNEGRRHQYPGWSSTIRQWTRDTTSPAKFVRSFPTMVITATVEYISASVNRFNRSAAASSSSLVAFGSGKFVALWESQVSFPLVSAVI
jgi:hypothetical protein